MTTSGLDALLKNGAGEIELLVKKPSGEQFTIATKHTMSVDQLQWLKAGSALNWIASQAGR